MTTISACKEDMKTRKLPLVGKHGDGKFAIVSDIDYDKVSQYSWYLHQDSTTEGLSYVCRTDYNGKRAKRRITVFLHSLILGKKNGYMVDHINRNTLDNRRENLRFVTPLQNNLNRRMFKKGLKAAKGYTKVGRKYQAQLHSKYLGTFNTAKEAHQRYLLEIKDSL